MVDFSPTFVATCGTALYRYFCGCAGASLADDLVQEVFERLLRDIQSQKYDPNRGTLKMYAFGIAHYVRLEAGRRQSKNRLQEVLEEESQLLPTYGFEKGPDLVDLRRAIDQLNADEQQITLLFATQECSLQEIADAMSMPLGTIKSHVHRIKNKLRQILTGDPHRE